MLCSCSSAHPTVSIYTGGQHGHQLQYEAGLAGWQLTFYAPAKEAMLCSTTKSFCCGASAPPCNCPGSGGQHGHQLQYEAGLAVWQLTFYAPAKEAMGAAGIVPGLVDTVRIASKEKVLTWMTLVKPVSRHSTHQRSDV